MLKSFGHRKVYDRYLFRELLSATLIGSVIAIVVLLALQVLRLSELIVRFDLDALSVLRMLGGLGISFTPLVFPIAGLFSMLIVFGRMSSDREFVAALAMGIPPKQLLRPAMQFGGVLVALSLWAAFSMGPFGNRMFEISIDEAFSKHVMTALRSGTFSEGFLNMVLFVDDIDPVSKELKRVFLHDTSSFKDEVAVSAQKGEWRAPGDQLNGSLVLRDGVLLSQKTEKDLVRRIQFKEYRINADFSPQTGHAKDSPPSQGFFRLLEKRAPSGCGAILAVSIACLLFVPLALGLSLDNQRTAKGRAVFSGLIILFGYWTIYFAIVSWIIKSPWHLLRTSEPLVWAIVWIPNLLILIAGTWIYRRRVLEIRS